MKLLFLTSRLPYPPNRGDRLRTYHLLSQLAQEHEITLVSFVTSKEEATQGGALDPLCAAKHLIVRPQPRSQLTTVANFWRRQPMQALYYRSRRMQNLVDQLLAEEEFDAVYAHLFRMAPYIDKCQDIYRVVDLTDVISHEIAASLPYRPVPSRLVYRLELPRIASYERQVAAWAEEAWLISERDRAQLAQGQPAANLHVVPNGVDLHRFYPMAGKTAEMRLLFVGHLDVFHNVDAAHYLMQEIFPRVRMRLPGCRLDIVGPGRGIKNSSLDHGVRVRGFVPDLNQALNEAAVFVAPLRFSAGVQNKVLEAMAAGLPVVTTKNVNDGLGAQAGKELLLGENTTDLVRAIVRLLENEPLRKRMGQAGRTLISERFSWRVAQDRMRHIEQQLLPITS
jgi:sugar transferase (PEP-CTERM/EpsH1 system associated)